MQLMDNAFTPEDSLRVCVFFLLFFFLSVVRAMHRFIISKEKQTLSLEANKLGNWVSFIF